MRSPRGFTVDTLRDTAAIRGWLISELGGESLQHQLALKALECQRIPVTFHVAIGTDGGFPEPPLNKRDCSGKVARPERRCLSAPTL